MSEYTRQIAEVRRFLKEKKMNAYDLVKIAKKLCCCGSCKHFVQHYTKSGMALDWGHCNKGNIQHSKRISMTSCGFWEYEPKEE